MDTNKLKETLLGYAMDDIDVALSEGRVLVTGTKSGNIEISYDAFIFTITKFPTGEPVRRFASIKSTAMFMATLYEIKTDS